MLKSFEPAIRQGHALAVMVAYHDIDGVPCTANPWLLNGVLRGEWGFQGFTLADLGAIRRLYDTHHVAATPADAVRLAINSGVDMQFYDFDHAVFQGALVEGVKAGLFPPRSWTPPPAASCGRSSSLVYLTSPMSSRAWKLPCGARSPICASPWKSPANRSAS